MSGRDDWSLRRVAPNVHEILWERKNASPDDILGTVLCISDTHLDAVGCNRPKLKRVLDGALKIGCPILFNGDLMDIMQSRDDPRRMPSERGKKYLGDNYIDQVVEDVCDFLEPYAHLIAFFGEGNHESAQVKCLGTDVLDRIAHELRGRVEGCEARKSGYAGWCRLKVNIESHRTAHSLMLHYHHGCGGAGGVTQGIAQAQRNSQAQPDADIVWTGHVHTEWATTWERWRVSKHLRVYQDEQLHFSTPGFVNSLGDGSRGWAVEKGNKPRPQGGAWIDVHYVYERDPERSGRRAYRRGLRPEYRRAK